MLRLLYIQRLPLHREVVHGDELLRPLHHVLLLCPQSHEVKILVVIFSKYPEVASSDAMPCDAHDASDDADDASYDTYEASDDACGAYDDTQCP